MGKKILVGAVGVFVVLGVILATVLYVWGPRYGASIVGRPIFVLPPTPERYAVAVLDLAQQRGIHASTPEFAQARTAAEQAAEQADDVSDIHDELNVALEAAGGKHSRLLSPDEMQEGLARPAAQPEVTSDGRIAIANVPAHRVEHDSQAYADTLAQGLHNAIDDGACGVVVDLRGNSGGDMGPMVAGLSGLIPDGPAMHFVDRHTEQPVIVEGNSVKGGGSAVSIDGAGKYSVPVAVLVDEGTASSGEMTMLALRGLENSRSFGEPTAGYTTANTVIDMPDGAQVMITVAQVRDRTGHVFNDTPIHPDETPAGDAVDAATRWLATERNCS